MIIGALLLMLATPAQIVAGTAVPDQELAAQRGGFELPNGIDVAITVQTQTVLNGAVVLKTVFKADQGPPTLTTYVPKPGTTVVAAASPAIASGSLASMPTVTYDRQNGIQVTPATVTPSVAVGPASSADSAIADGLVAIDPAAGAATDAGKISRVDTQSGVSIVRLDAPDFSVSHIVGNAFGSAISNSGSDRQIDTTTAISIDLSHAGPDVLGSAMLHVQDVAADAVGRRL